MTDLALLKRIEGEIKRFYPNAYIILPAAPKDAQIGAKSPILELFVSGREIVYETERSSVSTAVGSVVLSDELNTGLGRLDEMAERITQGFTPVNFNRTGGFKFTDSGLETSIYVAKVERSETGVYSNALKATVFITFEILESFRNSDN